MNKFLVVVFIGVVGLIGYARFVHDPVEQSEFERTEERIENPDKFPIEQKEAATAPPAPVLAATMYNEGFHTKGQWRGDSKVVDINGDGIQDVVTSLRRWDRKTMGDGLFVYLGTGQNTWKEMIEGFDRQLGYGGSSIADVDGDGKLDVAYSGHDKTPHVYLNFLDDETRPQWICATPGGLPTEVICSDVALGDFDRDGHVDCVTAGQFPGKGGVFLFRGDGHGSFAKEKIVIETAEEHYAAQVDFTDIDGDGHLELLATLDVGARVYHWDPRTDRAINEFEGHPDLSLMGSELGVEAVDLDGDGVQEVVTAGYPWEHNGQVHEPVRAFKRQEDGSWVQWGEGLPKGEGFFDVGVARMKPGGKPYLVVGGQWGIQMISMVQPGQFRSVGRIEDTARIFNLAVGDLTGDGKDDVVWIGEGGVRVYDVHPEFLKDGRDDAHKDD